MVQIRPALPADAPGISALAEEVQALHAVAHPRIFKPAGPGTFPPLVVRERMVQAGHRFWMAVIAGEVAGYAYMVVQEEAETTWRYATSVVTLDQMAVAARFRGRGAGRGLVAAVRDAATALGAAEVRLNVWAFNDGARAFYRRCGFEVVQERLWLPTDASASPRAPVA